jgi:hypothetical protein
MLGHVGPSNETTPLTRPKVGTTNPYDGSRLGAIVPTSIVGVDIWAAGDMCVYFVPTLLLMRPAFRSGGP